MHGLSGRGGRRRDLRPLILQIIQDLLCTSHIILPSPMSPIKHRVLARARLARRVHLLNLQIMCDAHVAALGIRLEEPIFALGGTPLVWGMA